MPNVYCFAAVKLRVQDTSNSHPATQMAADSLITCTDYLAKQYEVPLRESLANGRRRWFAFRFY
jgi:hypothetical protein